MIELIRVEESDRAELFGLLDEYLVELSRDIGIQGGPTSASEYCYFTAYWEEPGRYPFFIQRGSQRAGFLLVREVIEDRVTEMSEFYIRPEFRRSGMGRAALRELWTRFSGSWKLQVHTLNGPASEFWPRSIEAIIGSAPQSKEVREFDGRRIQYSFEVSEAE